ncbi:MAG: haloacid dehalogenase type II [Nitratireductor sp.]|nr:haloacid dehalogenase type II [Nitratireductor sp.]
MSTQIFVFDAYGTLFDVHSAVARHAALSGPQAERLSQIWRTKQLEYTWTRTAMGRYRDFQALTVEALDFALAAVPGWSAGAREALLEAYEALDCYGEVPGVLAELRNRGHRLAILSNGTPAMLARAVESAGIGSLLDDVISTDALRLYKTMPQAYSLVTDKYGDEPGAVSFQSSNRFDIAGASAFGFRCNWINRTRQPDEYPDLAPSSVLPDLTGLL